MKKIISIAVVIAVMLCGCSNNTYKHSDRLNAVEQTYWDIEEAINDFLVPDTDNVEYVKSVKEQISPFRELDEFDSLSWDVFDAVENAYTIDIEKVENLPEGASLNNIEATYIRKLDGIVLYPIIKTYPEDRQFHVMTHELCHALLSGSDVNKNHADFIVEGETELLAFTFTKSLGMESMLAYPNGVLVAAWLNDLFGAEQVRNAIIADNLDSIIDEVIGSGTYAKINLGGYMSECGIEAEAGRNAAIELLCHLSKALNKTDVGEKWLGEFTNIFGGVDSKYFKKILS